MARFLPSKFTAIALAIVVVWLAVGGVTGPIQGKLSDVQSNSNEEFLPKDSETTVVSARLAKFNSDAATVNLPMTIVLHRESGFTLADQPAIFTLMADLLALPAVSQYVATVDVPGIGQVPSAFPSAAVPGSFEKSLSADGSVAVLNINIDFAKLQDDKGAFKKLADVANHSQAVVDEAMQATAGNGYITGAVGIFAELAAAFAGIDGQLLITTLIAVALILVMVYRSPVLWAVPLMTAGLSLGLAAGAIYLLAKNDVIKVNGQSQGILSVLVLGAATDYALLMVSRYREELHIHANKWDAIAAAWKGTWEPIVASGTTVAIGLMCLELSQLRSSAGLGPVGAIGIVAALITTLTFLPAVLGLAGRRLFWPFVPKHGVDYVEKYRLWGPLATFVGKRARVLWSLTTVVLLVMAWGLTGLKANGISTVDAFVNQDAKPLVGLRLLEQHDLVPPTVDATVVAKTEAIQAVTEAVKEVEQVRNAAPRIDYASGTIAAAEGYSAIDVTFKAAESADQQYQAIADLREAVHGVDGADALVGGSQAAEYDVQQASMHDRALIIPVILLVITLILMALLRSILAPLLLLATTVLSFGAALGVSAFVFNNIMGYAGADASYPLYTFVFLVALGIDYNIFLMTRVREESIKLGTRAGTLKALTVTGGVITSAGVVLAATFAALGILPLVFMAELGFTVAFGVLMDTMIVRSILVPALATDIGKKIWWPSKLARAEEPLEKSEEVLLPAGS